MTGRTHDLAAFTILTAVVALNPPANLSLATGMTAVLANMIGGIAPDIDQPTAPFWRNLPIGGVAGRAMARLLGGHRFLSHSVLGVVLFGFGFDFLLNKLQPSFPNLNMDIIWASFMIGFVSHLIMDTLTREGVPWLLPVPVKFGLPPVKKYRVETGGIVERFIIFPILIIINIYLYYNNYQVFLDIIKSHIK